MSSTATTHSAKGLVTPDGETAGALMKPGMHQNKGGVIAEAIERPGDVGTVLTTPGVSLRNWRGQGESS
jgi:hypothetical protein